MYEGCFDDPHGADYYAVLQCDTSSTSSDIKASYYRLALQYHPDKKRLSDTRPPPPSSLTEGHGQSEAAISIQDGRKLDYIWSVPSANGLSFELVSEAYQVLSNEELRYEYDTRRAVQVHAGVNAEDISIDEFDRDDSCDSYHKQCRCGDTYNVSPATVT